MSTFTSDDALIVTGLVHRPELNNRAARVLNLPRRHDGRIAVEIFVGTEKVWIKPQNLQGPIPDVAAMCRPPYDAMPVEDRTEVGMLFFSKEPGMGRVQATAFPPASVKYNMAKPPIRRQTLEEVMGVDVCKGLSPDFPSATAARIVAYILKMVNYITPGPAADYSVHDNRQWCEVRDRVIVMLESGNDVGAVVAVLHAEFLAKSVPAPAPAPAPARETTQSRGLSQMQMFAHETSIKQDLVYECSRCGAHRPLGYRCCGRYCGTGGETLVERRNVHAHPDADEDEVADFLAAALARA